MVMMRDLAERGLNEIEYQLSGVFYSEGAGVDAYDFGRCRVLWLFHGLYFFFYGASMREVYV